MRHLLGTITHTHTHTHEFPHVTPASPGLCRHAAALMRQLLSTGVRVGHRRRPVSVCVWCVCVCACVCTCVCVCVCYCVCTQLEMVSESLFLLSTSVHNECEHTCILRVPLLSARAFHQQKGWSRRVKGQALTLCLITNTHRNDRGGRYFYSTGSRACPKHCWVRIGKLVCKITDAAARPECITLTLRHRSAG